MKIITYLYFIGGFDMKYIVKLFRSVREVVILIVATNVYAIKLFRYTKLFDRNKIGVREYKLYASNASYHYCCTCERYGLISADEAANAFDNFVENINKH